MNDTAFVQWLDGLLAEREQLRELFRRLRTYRLRSDRTNAQETIERIARFVLDPLALSKRDTPGSLILGEVVVELVNGGGLAGDLNSMQNRYVKGSHLGAWPLAVRERLYRLVGDFERLVYEKRAEAESQAA